MNRPLVTLLSAVITCALTATMLSAQSPQDKKAIERKEKLSPAGTWAGQIVNMDENKASFTLLVRIKLPYAYARPASSQSVTVHRGVKNVTQRQQVWVPDDVKIRVPVQPEFDEKGRPVPDKRKSNSEDPDRKLGGSPGSLQDLKSGQQVQVKLVRNRAGQLFAKTIHILQ